MAGNISLLWSSPVATDRDRKQLLRCVIDEVQILKEDRDVHLKIVWKGGALSEQTIRLPDVRSPRATSIDVVELIRKLAVQYTDEQIARVLIRKGCKTPTGLGYNAHRVANIRLNYGIECYRDSTDQQQKTYTIEQAAELFEVSNPTIYSWISAGILKGDQITDGALWRIYVTEEDQKRLKTQAAPEGWLPLETAATECGVNKQTVLNWVKEKKVEYVRVNHGRRKSLRIDISSVTCKKQPSLFS